MKLSPKSVAYLLAGMTLAKADLTCRKTADQDVFEFEGPEGKILRIEVLETHARVSFTGAGDLIVSEADLGFLMEVVFKEFPDDEWLPAAINYRVGGEGSSGYGGVTAWMSMRQSEMAIGYFKPSEDC